MNINLDQPESLSSTVNLPKISAVKLSVKRLSKLSTKLYALTLQK